jgi:beta-lactamase class A
MRRAWAIAAIAVALIAGATSSPATQSTWQPDVGQAKRYADKRAGDVRFAIRSFDGRAWRHEAGRSAPARSIVKVMFMAAYMRLGSVRDRELNHDEKALLGPMIRRSDDAAANAIAGRLSPGHLDSLARAAGMKRFRYDPVIWGDSRTSAADQMRLMHRLDRLVPDRHRRYARRLLRSITPAQRWGIADARPPGWHLHFKSGWGSGTGEADHQVAFLTRNGCRISLAIFTVFNPSHEYAKATQRGVARRLLAGLSRETCSASGAQGAAATRIEADLLASEKTFPRGVTFGESTGRLALTKAAYARMWRKFRLSARRPNVDFRRSAVLFAAGGESGSCPMLYRGMRANDLRGVLRIDVEIEGEVCTADWTPRTMAVELLRTDVPAGRLHGRFDSQGRFRVSRVRL